MQASASKPIGLVELAVESALRTGASTWSSLGELVAGAAARRPGVGVLAAALARRGDQRATESYLETPFVQVLRDAGLPSFERQVALADEAGIIGRVDFALGSVVIEIVGRRWHADKLDPDSYRYARLAAAGFTVLPFTFEHVELRRAHVVEVVARALGARQKRAG